MSGVQAGTTESQEAGGGIAESVSEQATQVAKTGRRELKAQLDERTTQVGRTTRSLADALRRSGQSIQSQGVDDVDVARITSGVADRLERAGGYLERVQGDQLLRDAERFVRSRPWLVTSAAAAAGLVASRVFKASSESRYDGSSTTPSTRSTAPRAEEAVGRDRERETAETGSLQATGRAY
jgi:hypothetical protein